MLREPKALFLVHHSFLLQHWISQYVLRSIFSISLSCCHTTLTTDLFLRCSIYFSGAASENNIFFHVLCPEMTAICILVVAACYMARVWLLFFSMKHATVLHHKEWGILVNPDLIERDWFFKNKNTYGDEAFVAGRTIAVTLLIILIQSGLNLGLYYLSGRTRSIRERFRLHIWFNCLVVFGMLLFLKAIWSRFPMHDAFGIRQEIQLALLHIFFIIGAIITTVVLTLFIPELRVFTPLFVALAWVVVLYDNVLGVCRENGVELRVCKPCDSQERRRLKSASRASRYSEIGVTWLRFVSERDGFEAFMAFLQSEFATESMLFIVEVSQLGHILEARGSASLAAHIVDCQVPSHLPTSYGLQALEKLVPDGLNQDAAATDELSRVCSALYDKYISDMAPLEINISYALKSQFQKLFADNARHSRTDLFENILPKFKTAAEQISGMMRGSFIRFKSNRPDLFVFD